MTADEFKSVYEDTWCARTQNAADLGAIVNAYQCDATWTAFMLGEPGRRGDSGCFLSNVGEKAGYSIAAEYYTLDCVYYVEKPNLVRSGLYPAGFDAIIEHENGERVEEEMWKLLMWRTPLKVLILYDYSDDVKRASTTKAAWLDEKFRVFACMAETMHDRCPEMAQNQYLFIVGSASAAGEMPRWRYFRLCQARWEVVST